LKVHYVIEKNDIYRFDDFEVDPARRRFSRNGAQIPLYPKAFDILVYLVSNLGRTVTKEEIFKSVWPESFVEEGILATQTASSRFPARACLAKTPSGCKSGVFLLLKSS